MAQSAQSIFRKTIDKRFESSLIQATQNRGDFIGGKQSYSFIYAVARIITEDLFQRDCIRRYRHSFYPYQI